MGMQDNITKSLLRATSDKTELNRKALKWKHAFSEIDQKLSGEKRKKK